MLVLEKIPNLIIKEYQLFFIWLIKNEVKKKKKFFIFFIFNVIIENS
jgi:hypothetical protein